MSGGAKQIISGGVASRTQVLSGALQYVTSHYGVNLATGQTAFTVGIAESATIFSGATQIVDSGGETADTIDAGGVLVESGGLAAAITIDGGYLDLQVGAIANGPIDFVDGGTLQIDGEKMPTAVISGWSPGDTIDLTGLSFNKNITSEFQPGDNTLTLISGTQSYDLHFDNLATLTSADFKLSQATSGGVQITYPLDGQQLSVPNGQSVSNVDVVLGGILLVEDGGAATGTLVSNGGSETIAFGGVDTGGTVFDGGNQIVLGTAIDTTVTDPGVQTVSSGGVSISATLTGGVQDVFGSAIATTIESGGTEYVYSGGINSGATVDKSGRLIVSGGGSDSGTVVDGGTESVSGVASNTTVGNGGTLTLFNGAVANGITISGSGTVDIESGGSAANVSFLGGGGLIEVIQPSGLGGTISNLGGGDTLDFVSASVTSAVISGTTLTITEAGYKTFNYQLAGVQPDTVVTLSGDHNNGTDVNLGSTVAIVQSVTASPPTGDLGPGAVVTFVVTLSKAVKVAGVTASTRPFLVLNNGGEATYKSGSGTNALTFSYAVGALGSGQDVVALAATGFNPNGAAVYDLGTTTAANLTAVSAFTSGPQIDTTSPQVTSIAASGPGIVDGDGDLRAGNTVTLTVTFSTAVYVTGTPYLKLNDNGIATYAGGSGTNTLTFSYQTAAGDNTVDLAVTALVSNGAGPSSGRTSGKVSAIVDGAGNKAILAPDAGTLAGVLEVDTQAPKIVSITTSGAGITAGNGDIGAGGAVLLTVNFNEAVVVNTVGGVPTLILNDGGIATYTGGSGSGMTFTYTVGALGSGQNTSDLKLAPTKALSLNGAIITDEAGNTALLGGANADNPAGTLAIDTTAPTVTAVIASPRRGEITTGDVLKITLDTSEAVSVSGTAELLLNDGGVASYDAAQSTAKALVFDYTVSAGDMTADLAVKGVELSSPSAITDLAGNNANLSAAGVDLGLKVNTRGGTGATPNGADFTVGGSTDLELFGASTAHVTFADGCTGTLKLDDARDFAGSVAGFAPGDVLDLADIAFGGPATLGFAPNGNSTGGTLSVTDGSHTANILLLMNYMASSFATAGDGHGGTAITDPPLANPAAVTQSHRT